MDQRNKGLIYIICGSLIVLISASEIIIRLLLAALGFYFIYLGIMLRHAHRVFINVTDFFKNFHDQPPS